MIRKGTRLPPKVIGQRVVIRFVPVPAHVRPLRDRYLQSLIARTHGQAQPAAPAEEVLPCPT